MVPRRCLSLPVALLLLAHAAVALGSPSNRDRPPLRHCSRALLDDNKGAGRGNGAKASSSDNSSSDNKDKNNAPGKPQPAKPSPPPPSRTAAPTNTPSPPASPNQPAGPPPASPSTNTATADAQASTIVNVYINADGTTTTVTAGSKADASATASGSGTSTTNANAAAQATVNIIRSGMPGLPAAPNSPPPSPPPAPLALPSPSGPPLPATLTRDMILQLAQNSRPYADYVAAGKASGFDVARTYTYSYPITAPGDRQGQAASTAPAAGGPAAATGFWRFALTANGTIAVSGAIGVHAMLTRDNNVLFLEQWHAGAPALAGASREANPYLTQGGVTDLGSIFNVSDSTFTALLIPEAPFSSGHVIAPDGHPVIFGGSPDLSAQNPQVQNGLFAVRDYHYPTKTINTTTTLGSSNPRWKPTAVTMASGEIIVAGGALIPAGGYNATTNQPAANSGTFQIYNFASRAISAASPLPILADTGPVNLYPPLFLLPVSGSLLVMAGNRSAVYDGAKLLGGTAVADAAYAAIPQLKVPFCYPQSAAVVLLPLDPANGYKPEVMVIGGSSVDQATAATPASNTSCRLDLSAAQPQWLAETMPTPRINHNVVLLPDGKLLVVNGAQQGIAGGSIGSGLATSPAFQPAMYDPKAAIGSRWSAALANSTVARLYQATALLMLDGSVMVAGGWGSLEYTVQYFSPPYLLTGTPRPVIEGTLQQVAAYNTTITIRYSRAAGADVKRVVLIRPAASTHSLQMDQRMIVLVIEQQAAGEIRCTAPPDSTIAPPGNYMLFLVGEDDVPSVAQYITVGFAQTAAV